MVCNMNTMCFHSTAVFGSHSAGHLSGCSLFNRLNPQNPLNTRCQESDYDSGYFFEERCSIDPEEIGALVGVSVGSLLFIGMMISIMVFGHRRYQRLTHADGTTIQDGLTSLNSNDSITIVHYAEVSDLHCAPIAFSIWGFMGGAFLNAVIWLNPLSTIYMLSRAWVTGEWCPFPVSFNLFLGFLFLESESERGGGREIERDTEREVALTSRKGSAV